MDTKQQKSAVQIRAFLDKNVAPENLGLQIQQVVPVEDKLIIKLNTESQAARLRDELKTDKFSRYEVREVARRLPAVIIFNVPQRFSAHTVLEALQKSGRFKVRTQLKARDPLLSHWIVEGEAEDIDKLLSSSRLCIGFTSCFLKRFFSVQRCYNCQRIGHISRRCRFPSTCASCGESHKTDLDCSAVPVSCTNCVHHNKAKDTNWSTDHPAHSKSCLCFKEAVKVIQAGYTWSNPVDMVLVEMDKDKDIQTTAPTGHPMNRRRQNSECSVASVVTKSIIDADGNISS